MSQRLHKIKASNSSKINFLPGEADGCMGQLGNLAKRLASEEQNWSATSCRTQLGIAANKSRKKV
jgi:hypothetical protein